MSEITGARCVVTGGARGMGRLLAKRFLEDGARVVLLDVDGAELDKTCKELSALGYVRGIRVDLTDGEALYEAAAEAEADLGGVDILVNNAGVVTGGPLAEVSDARHELTYAVNILAVVRMTRALLPGMLERGRGHVVNMASAAGLTAVPLQTTYCSSKWAAVGFSEALRAEMNHLGHPVKVTCVCPGYVDTGMFDGVKAPLTMPMLDPDDVVDSVIKAIRTEQRTVTMPLIVGAVPLMRAVMPGALVDRISDILGVNKSMETWRGRQ